MHLTRSFSASAAVFSIVLFGACGGGGGGGTDAQPVGPPAAIAPVGPSSSVATAGATTPITLVAKVTDAGGHPVAGASVTWSTGFGSITPNSASTDGSGQSSAQWLPGNVAGASTAAATVTGAGTATFTATVTPAAPAKVKVSPDTVRLVAAGGTAQISAVSTDAFDNTIPNANLIYSSRDQSVATVSTSGVVTAVGNGKTTIDVSNGVTSTPVIVIVNITSQAVQCDAPGSVSLAVGESKTYTGTAAGQICIAGASGAEYVAVPFYATGFGGSGSGAKGFIPAPTLSLTLSPVSTTPASGPPTPSVGSNSQMRTSVSVSGDRVLRRDYAWEARFRNQLYRELSPILAARRKRQAHGGAARLNVIPGISRAVVPTVGSKMSLNVNVNNSCTSTTNPPIFVDATVMAVGTHAIVVNDDRNPGAFTQADFQEFANTFDQLTWDVDTQNFGVPTDVDDNGARVILFFTRAVNELTPKGSNSFVGGFFFGRDFYAKDEPCDNLSPHQSFVVGSNHAEMFYLLTPDPDGTVNTNVRSTSFVKSITAGTVAHEFQHLINFTRHASDLNPTPFTAFESPFLDEGLAHIAEELNLYASAGLAPRTNINAGTATIKLTEWRAYGEQNAVRFREYLKNPDKYPPYSSLADTSLAVRGGIWSFLRYAADRRSSSVPEKGSDNATWFLLVNPKVDVHGVDNLKTVFGNDVLLQMRDWAVSNYVDDIISNPLFQQPSWNIRSVETYVNGSGFANGTTYPLKVQTLSGSPIPLVLADGGAAYLRFGIGAGVFGGVTITSQSPLLDMFSVTVVRTK